MTIKEKYCLIYYLLFFFTIVTTFYLTVCLCEAADSSAAGTDNITKFQLVTINKSLENKKTEGANFLENKTDIDEVNRTVPGAAPNFRAISKEKSSILQAFFSPTFLKAVSRFFIRLIPGQGGTIWLSIIITILVAFNFRRINTWRNINLLLFMILSLFFIDLIHLGNTWTIGENSTQNSLFGLMFSGIFLISVILFCSSLYHSYRSENEKWIPNLPRRALMVAAFVLIACNTLVTLVRFPDDCGIYINFGANRMVETGKFPYGDPILHGGAAATYGPILYLAHIPFQIPFSNINKNISADEHPFQHWIMAGGKEDYNGVPILASKLTLLFFHFVGLIGLFMIGKRMCDPSVGWALICLYAGSAFVQGLGGKEYFISGLTYISHIAPAAITIMAFALFQYPLWGGVLLAIGAGALFYPAFFFPLWLGYYFWKRNSWKQFCAGFIIVSLIIGIAVLLMTETSGSENALQVVYESTVGHQESKTAYGSSSFSFWGTHPRISLIFQSPLIEGLYLLKPSFLIFICFIVLSFFMSRGKTLRQLSFLTASIGIAVQLWKSHAGGTYVEWYYPFFLIGFFTSEEADNVDLYESGFHGRMIK